MEKYYTQRLARQWALRIVPLPEHLQLGNILRFRLTEEEFLDAYHVYIALLESIYEGIYQDPTSFGMVCLEIEPSQGSLTKEESRSLKSFGRLADTLCAVAELGTFTSDNGCCVPVDALKLCRIPKVNKILDGLHQHGIFVERTEGAYLLYCEDNSNIFRVMKSLSEAGIGKNIVTADFRYLLYGRDHVVFEPEDFIRLLPEEYQKQVVRDICARYESLGYCVKTEYTYNPARIRISKNRCGKESVSIRLERDDRMWIGLRPSTVVEHTELFETLAENILSQTLSGRDCIQCGWCNDGGVRFSYGGEEYYKCGVICCNFQYSPACEADCASIMRLIHAVQ